MHFVQVIYHYWTGGAEKQVFLISQALVRAGHACTVFPVAAADSSPRVAEWIERARRAGVVVSPSPTGFAGGVRNLGRLWSTLKATDPAVLWCWGNRAEFLCKLLASAQPRVRLLGSLRSADEARIAASVRILRFRAKRVFGYVSNSQKALDLAAGVLGARMPRGFVLHNALEDPFPEPERCPAPDGVIRVAMLGNIRRHLKGYDDLIRLATMIRQQSLPVHFTVAGRPDEGEWFLAALREARLEGCVRYVGPVADPLAFLRQHHVYLLLSRVEGFPNTLLEAMSLGLPCISTRVGDLAEMVEDGTHLHLVKVSDVDEILVRLRRVLADWSSASRMGSAGRDWCFQRFSQSALESGVGRLVDWIGGRESCTRASSACAARVCDPGNRA